MSPLPLHHLIVIFVLLQVCELNVFLTVSGAIYCKLLQCPHENCRSRGVCLSVDHQRDVRNIVEYAKI